MFDVHSSASFEVALRLLRIVLAAVAELSPVASPRVLLVGTKIDDVGARRAVGVAEAAAAARGAHRYLEASAHTGLHVAAVLEAALPPPPPMEQRQQEQDETLAAVARQVAEVQAIASDLTRELASESMLISSLDGRVDGTGSRATFGRAAAAGWRRAAARGATELVGAEGRVRLQRQRAPLQAVSLDSTDAHAVLVQSGVAGAQAAMAANISRTLDRGATLDDLELKSEELTALSGVFLAQAHALRRRSRIRCVAVAACAPCFAIGWVIKSVADSVRTRAGMDNVLADTENAFQVRV